MRRTPLLSALLCIGCGTSPATTGLTFDPCASNTVVAATATADEGTSIDDAIAMWRDRGVTELARTAGPSSISVVFHDAGPAIYGAYDDATATIYVNVELTDRTERAIAIAHELGHAFALVHVATSERGSVMNPGNLTIAPTDGDRAALEAIWGSCPR